MMKPWERNWDAPQSQTQAPQPMETKPWERNWAAPPPPADQPSMGERFQANLGEAERGTRLGANLMSAEAERFKADAAGLLRSGDVNSLASRAGAFFSIDPAAQQAMTYARERAAQEGVDLADQAARRALADKVDLEAAIALERTQLAERDRRAEYAAMPSFRDAPTFGEQVLQGGAALAGQIAGAAMSPESWIGFGRAASMAGAIGRGAAGGAAGAAIADPAVQGTNIELGLQEGYDPGQAATSIGAGAAAGGVLGGAGRVIGNLIDRARAPAEAQPPQVEPILTPEQPPPEQIAPEQLAAQPASEQIAPPPTAPERAIPERAGLAPQQVMGEATPAAAPGQEPPVMQARREAGGEAGEADPEPIRAAAEINAVDNQEPAVRSDGQVAYALPVHKLFGLEPDQLRQDWADTRAITSEYMADYKADRPPRIPLLSGTSASGTRLPPVLQDVANFGRRLMYSVDGRLEALERQWGTPEGPAPEIRYVREALNAPAGRPDEVGRTFHEATSMEIGKRTNEALRIMKPIASDKSAMDQMVRLVQNPENINPATSVGRAAQKIAGLLDDTLAYLRGAGVDIKGVEGGYFPRLVDEQAVRNNPEKFKAAYIEQKIADGLSRQEAEAMAKSYLDNLTLGFADARPGVEDLTQLGVAANSSIKKARVLSKEADERMREFLVQDPVEALTLYFMKAARRAEWARRFGDQNEVLVRLNQQLVDRGAAPAVGEMMRLVQAGTGQVASTISPPTRRALSFVRTGTVLATMAQNALSSLSEVAMVGLRTGSVRQQFSGFYRILRNSLSPRIDDPRAAREMAESIGVVAANLEGALSRARYVDVEPQGKLEAMVTDRFFRVVLAERFTDAVRVMAVENGQEFLRALARDAGRGNRRAVNSLKELGVPESQVPEFSAWVAEQTQNGAVLRPGDVRDEGNGALYRTALTRFVYDVAIRPTPALKPAWAQTDLGSLMFQLSSFTWAFQKQVLNRQWELIKRTFKEKDVGLLAGSPFFALIVAIQYALIEPRMALTGVTSGTEPRELTPEQKLTLAIDRSGLTGVMSPLVNLTTGIRYGRDIATTLAGPGPGLLLGAADAAIKAAGSGNTEATNTAERRLIEAGYQSVVKPVAVGAMQLAPVGPILRAAGTQIVGSPGGKTKAADVLAGPKQERGARNPLLPQRPSRPARPNVRG